MLAGDGVGVEYGLSAVARDMSLADRVVNERALRFIDRNQVAGVQRVERGDAELLLKDDATGRLVSYAGNDETFAIGADD